MVFGVRNELPKSTSMCVSLFGLLLCKVAYADIREFGNVATNKICNQHNQSNNCWSPLHFDNRSTKNLEKSKKPQKKQFSLLPQKKQQKKSFFLDYTTFWRRHGHEVEKPCKIGGRSRGAGLYEVIHLRCGDILVRNHHEYTVPTTECINTALAWLPSPEVYLLVGGHSVDSRDDAVADRRCAALTKRVVSVIQAAGKRVTLLTNGTQCDDWATLVGARYVLALISSSFVFTAKVRSLSDLKMISAAVTSAAPWWFHCAATQPTSQLARRRTTTTASLRPRWRWQ